MAFFLVYNLFYNWGDDSIMEKQDEDKIIESCKCEVCGIEIEVDEGALKLCNKCFDEKCENCGHKRASYIDNNGTYIFEFILNHKTKRGQFCSCSKFIKRGKKK